jgi:hypothetical protein
VERMPALGACGGIDERGCALKAQSCTAASIGLEAWGYQASAHDIHSSRNR